MNFIGILIYSCINKTRDSLTTKQQEMMCKQSKWSREQ